MPKTHNYNAIQEWGNEPVIATQSSEPPAKQVRDIFSQPYTQTRPFDQGSESINTTAPTARLVSQTGQSLTRNHIADPQPYIHR